MKTYPPPPSTRKRFPDPVAEINASHLAVLDPTGIRQRLFARSNPDALRPGDILLVTFKTGDPFAGVCLSIRRRGPDTAVLLRNRLLMTGVEMWVKVFSPTVSGIELVKRAERRIRRARLFYMRYVFLWNAGYDFQKYLFLKLLGDLITQSMNER
jgi:ribosomal protein L19